MTVTGVDILALGRRSLVSRRIRSGFVVYRPASRKNSDSHSSTCALTASVRRSVTVRSYPCETSLVIRMWARRGSDDPSSIQARMINTPVRSVSTFPPAACRTHPRAGNLQESVTANQQGRLGVAWFGAARRVLVVTEERIYHCQPSGPVVALSMALTRALRTNRIVREIAPGSRPR